MEQRHFLETYPTHLDGVRYFSQDDPRWAEAPYTACDNPSQTIGSSGCMPAQQAMLVTSLTGIEVTPRSMAEFNIDRGFRTADNGTDHHALFSLKAFGGIHTLEIAASEIGIALELGGLVTASGRLTDCSPDTIPGTYSGHMYGIRRMENEMVWVNDPKNLEKSVRTHRFAELLPTFRKLYASFCPS